MVLFIVCFAKTISNNNKNIEMKNLAAYLPRMLLIPIGADPELY